MLGYINVKFLWTFGEFQIFYLSQTCILMFYKKFPSQSDKKCPSYENKTTNLQVTLPIFGHYIAYIWALHCLYLGITLPIFGHYIAYIWALHCLYLDITLPIFGHYIAYIWALHCLYSYIWASHCLYLGITLPIFGHYIAYIWALHCLYLGIHTNFRSFLPLSRLFLSNLEFCTTSGYQCSRYK